jgi:integral membrane protein (TIGR01906 family)
VVIDRVGRAAASLVVAAATALVIVAVAIVPFLNPLWVSFEQDRARADVWTGYAPAQLRQATDALLSDLIIGPPDFDVAVGGQPVLDERERSHMRDVRGVFTAFAVLALIGGLLLVVMSRLRPRAGFWGAVRIGAASLTLGVVVAAVASTVAFVQVFEFFHAVFFPSGSYDFDPRTDRLVQLFPEQFWFDTALVLAIVILMLSLLVWRAAATRLLSGGVDGTRAASPALQASR